ncbi:MAG: DUF1295 domain-containing protein [Bacteroidetes bacterium]|nr:DUF1295 domain-containing protein [Bacteroidota bacterium]
MNEKALNILSVAWIAVAVVTLPFLLRITQPYGRHASKKWGAMMDNSLGWIIQEIPSPLVLSIFFFTGSGVKTPGAWLLWALWMLHYLNRCFVYPLRIRTRGKKIPVLIVVSAICFNCVNGFLNGSYLGNFGEVYGSDFFTSAQFLIGLPVFIIGAVINNYSDSVLINLRKPGETGYKIPTGGLFKYVSCPNHFGEIVEWWGFAIVAMSLPAWSFSIWTICNLIPRTLDNHRWYLDKFPDYPKDRKAVVPFVL